MDTPESARFWNHPWQQEFKEWLRGRLERQLKEHCFRQGQSQLKRSPVMPKGGTKPISPFNAKDKAKHNPKAPPKLSVKARLGQGNFHVRRQVARSGARVVASRPVVRRKDSATKESVLKGSELHVVAPVADKTPVSLEVPAMYSLPSESVTGTSDRARTVLAVKVPVLKGSGLPVIAPATDKAPVPLEVLTVSSLPPERVTAVSAQWFVMLDLLKRNSSLRSAKKTAPFGISFFSAPLGGSSVFRVTPPGDRKKVETRRHLNVLLLLMALLGPFRRGSLAFRLNSFACLLTVPLTPSRSSSHTTSPSSPTHPSLSALQFVCSRAADFVRLPLH